MHVTFDGGRLTSDAGVLVLAEIERRLEIAERLARCLTDPRAPERVCHTLAEMIRFRVLLIAAGYPDANDCDPLRIDPAFKMAVGRLPESGRDLCSQPTMCRLENLPGTVALKRMMAAMVELFCDSFEEVPRRIVLDIDDTEDRVHGQQQLSLFHAYYDSYCFLPIHIYEAVTGKPVAVILRPGKTPDGAEVALVLRHVIGAIRRRWPRVDILVRGDSHYGRPEAMAWCERNRVAYIFGLAGNQVLLRRVAGLAEAVALERVASGTAKVRRYAEFAYAARTWHAERRVIGRIEASERGADSRFIVTNLPGTPRWLYEEVYCARGQADIYQALCVSRVSSGMVASRMVGPMGSPGGAPASARARRRRPGPAKWAAPVRSPRGVHAANRAGASDRPTGRASPSAPPVPAASVPWPLAVRPRGMGHVGLWAARLDPRAAGAPWRR